VISYNYQCLRNSYPKVVACCAIMASKQGPTLEFRNDYDLFGLIYPTVIFIPFKCYKIESFPTEIYFQFNWSTFGSIIIIYKLYHGICLY